MINKNPSCILRQQLITCDGWEVRECDEVAWFKVCTGEYRQKFRTKIEVGSGEVREGNIKGTRFGRRRIGAKVSKNDCAAE